MHHLEGPENRKRYKEGKSPAPDGIWTNDILIKRCVLYHCATTAAWEEEEHEFFLNADFKVSGLLKLDWRQQAFHEKMDKGGTLSVHQGLSSKGDWFRLQQSWTVIV